MAATLKPGVVLLPQVVGAHPHVVLSDSFGSEKFILMVNWTTLDAECIDDACVLEPGDHPIIVHASSMAYSRAHLWREDKIIFALHNFSIKELAPISASVLERMIGGARKSPELRAEWKAVLPRQ